MGKELILTCIYDTLKISGSGGNRMYIAICDDDYNFIETVERNVKNILKQNQRICNIETFISGKDLIERSKETFADAVLLDIDMPEISGFEVAEELQKIKSDAIIIFITSHEDKVYQSWEYQPFWFVRKNHLQDLSIVLKKLFAKIDANHEKEKNIYMLNTEGKPALIDINTVSYIQAYKHYILINGENNERNQVRCKISDAEQQLYPLYFIRIQNSIIVNCRFISKVTSRSVVLNTGEEMSISRNRLEYVRNEFQRFIRSR